MPESENEFKATLDNDFNVVDPSTVSARSVGLKWGIILGIFGVVAQLIGYLTGISNPANTNTTGIIIFSIVVFVVSIYLLYMAIREHREQQLGGYITTGRCGRIGLWVGLFAGIISAIWTFVFNSFIAPEMMQEAMDLQIIAMEEQGLSDEQIEAAVELGQMSQGPAFLILGTLIGSVLIYGLISLIIGLFAKKNPPGYA